MNTEELTEFILKQTEKDLKLIYHFSMEEVHVDEKYASFIRGRIRGYCSAVFSLLLKLRSIQSDVDISNAIHDLIKQREYAEKRIEEFVSNK